MARDEKGNALPPIDLLTEVQSLLRQALSVEVLPHQIRNLKQGYPQKRRALTHGEDKR